MGLRRCNFNFIELDEAGQPVDFSPHVIGMEFLVADVPCGLIGSDMLGIQQ